MRQKSYIWRFDSWLEHPSHALWRLLSLHT